MRLLRGALLAILLLVGGRADAAWHSVLQTAVTSGGGGSTAVFVKSTTCSAFSGSTVTCSLATVGAGHLITLVMCGQPDTLILSSATVGGNAATLFSASAIGGGDYCRGAMYPNSPSGTVSIVGTVTGTCSNCNMEVEEYSGLTTTATVDGNNITYTLASTIGTSLPSGSFTTTTNGDMIWTIIFQPQLVTPTLPVGYSAGRATGPWWSAYLSPQILAGSTNPTFLSGASSFDNFVLGVGIKP